MKTNNIPILSEDELIVINNLIDKSNGEHIMFNILASNNTKKKIREKLIKKEVLGKLTIGTDCFYIINPYYSNFPNETDETLNTMFEETVWNKVDNDRKDDK